MLPVALADPNLQVLLSVFGKWFAINDVNATTKVSELKDLIEEKVGVDVPMILYQSYKLAVRRKGRNEPLDDDDKSIGGYGIEPANQDVYALPVAPGGCALDGLLGSAWGS